MSIHRGRWKQALFVIDDIDYHDKRAIYLKVDNTSNTN